MEKDKNKKDPGAKKKAPPVKAGPVKAGPVKARPVKASLIKRGPKDLEGPNAHALKSEWSKPSGKNRVSNTLIDTFMNFEGGADEAMITLKDGRRRALTADEMELFLVIAMFFDGVARTGQFNSLIREVDKGKDDFLFMGPLEGTDIYVKLSYLTRSQIWGSWKKGWILEALNSFMEARLLSTHLTDSGVIQRISTDTIRYTAHAYQKYKGLKEGEAKLYVQMRLSAPFLAGLLGAGKGFTYFPGNFKYLADAYGKMKEGKRAPLLFLRMFVNLLKLRERQQGDPFTWSEEYILNNVLGEARRIYCRNYGTDKEYFVRSEFLRDIKRNMRAFTDMGLLKYATERPKANNGTLCYEMIFNTNFLEEQAQAYKLGFYEAKQYLEAKAKYSLEKEAKAFEELDKMDGEGVKALLPPPLRNKKQRTK